MAKKKPETDHYRVAFDAETGKRFAHARIQMGLRQADLGALLGVSQDHIWRLETGKSEVSLFSAGVFRTVMRGRISFVLFGENPHAFKFYTDKEQKEFRRLALKAAGDR